jgi:hypothetical protein
MPPSSLAMQSTKLSAERVERAVVIGALRRNGFVS